MGLAEKAGGTEELVDKLQSSSVEFRQGA